MSLTSIASKFFFPRQKALERHFGEGLALQDAVLRYLLSRGRLTEYGRRFGFENIKNYEDFARQVPLTDYEALKDDIDRMRRGENDVLWPGRTKWFAKSSGTTNDKSKFIPVTAEGLKNLHYQGGSDVVAFYLKNL